MIIAEILSYPFLARALFVGFLISISSSLLGVSLVLRRYSMIGDGLSHVGFGALGIASLLSLSPLYVTLPVVVVSAFLLLRLSQRKGGGDSAIALLSSSSLAIGVAAVSIGGVNTDLNAFLFGSILSVSRSDALISLAVSIVTLFTYLVFYHQIYATTFDPVFAKATGLRCERYNNLLALLTALVIVVGMRMLGSMLISSLLIFPSLSAMKVARTYFRVSVIAAIESVAAFLAGFIASYAFSLPTGASIVIAHMLIYIMLSGAGLLIRRSHSVVS